MNRSITGLIIGLSLATSVIGSPIAIHFPRMIGCGDTIDSCGYAIPTNVMFKITADENNFIPNQVYTITNLTGYFKMTNNNGKVVAETSSYQYGKARLNVQTIYPQPSIKMTYQKNPYWEGSDTSITCQGGPGICVAYYPK